MCGIRNVIFSACEHTFYIPGLGQQCPYQDPFTCPRRHVLSPLRSPGLCPDCSCEVEAERKKKEDEAKNKSRMNDWLEKDAKRIKK
jgi:hypothetical protein